MKTTNSARQNLNTPVHHVSIAPLLKIFQNQTFLQEHSIVCAFLLRRTGAGSFNFPAPIN